MASLAEAGPPRPALPPCVVTTGTAAVPHLGVVDARSRTPVVVGARLGRRRAWREHAVTSLWPASSDDRAASPTVRRRRRRAAAATRRRAWMPTASSRLDARCRPRLTARPGRLVESRPKVGTNGEAGRPLPTPSGRWRRRRATRDDAHRALATARPPDVASALDRRSTDRAPTAGRPRRTGSSIARASPRSRPCATRSLRDAASGARLPCAR